MINYFEIMGIKMEYDVDHDDLHRKYLELMLISHPDKSGQHAFDSTLLNAAYSTIKDDLLRAEHLLALNGLDVNTTKTEQAFIEDILLEFEFIETASETTLIQEKYDAKLMNKKSLFQDLKNTFNSGMMQDALEIFVRLRYLNTLIQALSNAINRN